MSRALVERVGAAQRALSAALDAGVAAEIEAATAALARDVETLRTVGAWRPDPALKGALMRSLREGEGARIRARYLADHARGRLARLQALRGRGAMSYGRDGMLRRLV